MRSLSGRQSAYLDELSALLARAYLRLTQEGPNDAISRPREPQKPLDVSATESPHVVEESAQRRAQ